MYKVLNGITWYNRPRPAQIFLACMQLRPYCCVPVRFHRQVQESKYSIGKPPRTPWPVRSALNQFLWDMMPSRVVTFTGETPRTMLSVLTVRGKRLFILAMHGPPQTVTFWVTTQILAIEHTWLFAHSLHSALE